MVTLTPTLLRDDLLVEVLLRVPVRSLLRCKCVCKSWLSLISNPLFAKSHFEAAAAPTDRFLVKFPNDSEAISVDIEVLCPNSAHAVFNIPIPPRAPKHGRWARIVGSCRGFLLLKYEFLHFVDFMVWNPSTGVQKYIYNMSTHSCLCGIGYDSSTDDYVIVNLTLERRTYFSLRTNSWSCIEYTVPFNFGPAVSGQGLLFNGNLHWLVRSSNSRLVIIAFDVVERKFSEISVPHNVAIGHEFKVYQLRVMEECLCIYLEGYYFETWTMKEYKLQSSWTKSFVLSTNYYYSLPNSFPICFTKIRGIWT